MRHNLKKIFNLFLDKFGVILLNKHFNSHMYIIYTNNFEIMLLQAKPLLQTLCYLNVEIIKTCFQLLHREQIASYIQLVILGYQLSVVIPLIGTRHSVIGAFSSAIYLLKYEPIFVTRLAQKL